MNGKKDPLNFVQLVQVLIDYTQKTTDFLETTYKKLFNEYDKFPVLYLLH